LKPTLNHPHWNTLEYHYITYNHVYTMYINFHICPPWSATNNGTHNLQGHWTSLVHYLTIMNYWSLIQWTNALNQKFHWTNNYIIKVTISRSQLGGSASGKRDKFYSSDVSKKGQGKGLHKRNYCEDVKEWMPPTLSSLDFWNNNSTKVLHFVVHISNNLFFTFLPPLGFKLFIISFA
jgi:hypothetical protein